MKTKIPLLCSVALAACIILSKTTIMGQSSVSSPPSTSITAYPTNGTGASILANWQAPIDFYGKVIDQNSNPVAGATISFNWVETLTEDGNRSTNTVSDADGLFSLHGARGPDLAVSVSKDGYYSSREEGHPPFKYGFFANGQFTPDPLNPVIFHLYKKGQGVYLMTSQRGVRPDLAVLVPRDGTPVRVDLLQRKVNASGDLEIAQVKPNRGHWQEATNWSFHMSMSDGGFIENSDEFPFHAPEAGYQSKIDLDFMKGTTNWTRQFVKNYYIVFGQPQKYGSLRVEANITQQTVFLQYAINPTGSRNLEPAQ